MPRLVYLDRAIGWNKPTEGWGVSPHPEKEFPVISAGCLPGSKIPACIYLGGRHTNSFEQRILRGEVQLRDKEGGGKRAVLCHEPFEDDSRICVCVAAKSLLDEPSIQDPKDGKWKLLRRGEAFIDRGVEVYLVGEMPDREIRHFFCLHDGGSEVRLRVMIQTLPDIVCHYRYGQLVVELRYFDD